jgi:hypothetical protein
MEANVLAGTSLALLMLKILFLNRLSSVFPGAYDLGMLLEAVLGSVVASYAFFVVVVHFRAEAERAQVLPYVAKHVGRVIEQCKFQLNAISSATSVTLDLSSTSLADITTAFTKLDPYGDAPMIISPDATGNWLQYLDHYAIITRRTVGRLFIQLPYLDAELVRLLTAVDDSDHFVYFENTDVDTPVGNRDLESWAPAFHDYCVSLQTSPSVEWSLSGRGFQAFHGVKR